MADLTQSIFLSVYCKTKTVWICCLNGKIKQKCNIFFPIEKVEKFYQVKTSLAHRLTCVLHIKALKLYALTLNHDEVWIVNMLEITLFAAYFYVVISQQ